MNLYIVFFTDGSRGEVNGRNENDAIATAQARFNKAVARVSFSKKVDTTPVGMSDFEFLHSFNSVNG